MKEFQWDESYLNNRDNSIEQRVPYGDMSRDDAARYLFYIVKEGLNSNPLNVVNFEFLIYLEMKFEQDKEIQSLMRALKHQIYKQYLFNAKLFTVAGRTPQQSEHVENYICGRGLRLFSDRIREAAKYPYEGSNYTKLR